MKASEVKSRRDYWTTETPSMGGYPVVPRERVRVTGFSDVNGEKWCRIKYEGDKVSKILMHPSNLDEEA